MCRSGIARPWIPRRIRRVELRHLRAFVAVAEEGTFTRAARRLHLSQPPLSKQVRQLERELGTTLFVRRPDGIELTRDGAMLLERAQAALTAIRRVRGVHEIGQLARASAAARHRVGLVGSGGTHSSPSRPTVSRNAHRGRGQLLGPQSHEGTAHGRVRGANSPWTRRVYDSQPLFEEHFIVLLADSHPLASRKSIQLSQLANDPLLLYDRDLGPSVYDKTLALFKAAGVQPHVVGAQPPPYAQGAMMLVASRQGYYLGIASPFTQTHRVSGVAVVPLDEPDARLQVRIAWRRSDTLRAATSSCARRARCFPGSRRGQRAVLRSYGSTRLPLAPARGFFDSTADT